MSTNELPTGFAPWILLDSQTGDCRGRSANPELLRPIARMLNRLVNRRSRFVVQIET